MQNFLTHPLPIKLQWEYNTQTHTCDLNVHREQSKKITKIKFTTYLLYFLAVSLMASMCVVVYNLGIFIL
jgi:hypothetical protein